MADVVRCFIFINTSIVLLLTCTFHACNSKELVTNEATRSSNNIKIDFTTNYYESVQGESPKRDVITEIGVDKAPSQRLLHLGKLRQPHYISKKNMVADKQKATKSHKKHHNKNLTGGKRSQVSGQDEMKDGLLGNPEHGKSKDQQAVKRQHFENQHESEEHHHLDERPILGRCDINEKCKAEQYCQGRFCFKCRKALEHCYANGQCCQGMECQYGYCAKGISAGMPGTYCDKAKDCKGSEACCILEMSVDHHNAICKPMLEQHETCGPINLFHQITEYRAHNEPFCGPCKQGLACKSVGIFGHHSVCLPEGGD